MAVVGVVLAVAAGCSGSGPSDRGAGPPPATGAAGGSSTSSSPADESPGSAAGAPDASAGCGKALVPGLHGVGDVDDDVARTLTVDGAERSYRLGVPRGSDNRIPQPLVLNLHGSGSNAVQQSVYSRLPTRGGQRGYVVVTPDAIGGQWQLFPTGSTDSPDLNFVKALLDTVESELCIDRHRVFATGISLGSAMASDLACAWPDRIAAVGNVAEEVVFKPCARTLAVIAFHGTEDHVVPFKAGDVAPGQPNAGLPGTERNMAGWAELDGCDATPQITTIGTEVQHSVWSGCDRGAAIELYTVLGGGHTWPGSPIKVDHLGATTAQIDATALVLDFFDAHPLTP